MMSKNLKDVPVNPIAACQKLAALAPKEPARKTAGKPETKGKPRPKKSQPRGSQDFDWGEFNEETYLRENLPSNIEINIIKRGDRTLYRLSECFFDPSHKRNDAYIQKDASGGLSYCCSHDTCNHTWAELRQRLTGTDNLRKYMSGYDPNFKKVEKKAAGFSGYGDGFIDKIDISYEAPIGVPPGVPAVPPPDKIDPREFFRQDMRGNIGFVPILMSKYYVAYLKNLVHTSDVYWQYHAGVWKRFSTANLNKICVNAMGDAVRANHLDATVKILRGLVNKEHDEWPEWKGHINCLNGMVDISTGNKADHDPTYGSMSQIPCMFDWDAYRKDIEPWFTFLDQVFPGKEDRKSVLQQFFGYCLLPDCRFEKALFMKGDGGNGKGTVSYVLRAMLGPENCSSLTMEHIADPRFSLYFLQGKLINEISELSQKKTIEVELFKKIVSGEPLTVERKYGDKYEFSPYVKIIIAMNDMPVIPDTSYGFKRRLIVLNFDQTFEGADVDVGLKPKLAEKKDAIFMWALLGLQKLLENNEFVIGGTVKDDTDKFFKGLDPASEFLDEYVEAVTKEAVLVQELYSKYTKWCKDVGHKPFSRRNFNKRVERFFPSVIKDKHGDERRIHWIGLDWKIEALL